MTLVSLIYSDFPGSFFQPVWQRRQMEFAVFWASPHMN